MKRGPRIGDLRLGRKVERRRRIVRLRRHDTKGERMMFWCEHCQRFTYNMRTHVCRVGHLHD